jgi:hypothetical protein
MKTGFVEGRPNEAQQETNELQEHKKRKNHVRPAPKTGTAEKRKST